MVTADYLNNLMDILNSNSSDHSYEALTTLIAEPTTQQKSLVTFHAEIEAILSKPLPERSRLARFFGLKKSEHNLMVLRHRRLCTELRARMTTQKLMRLPTIAIVPSTPTGAIETPSKLTSSGESDRSATSNSSIRSLYKIPEYASDHVLPKEVFNNFLLIHAHRYAEPHNKPLLRHAMIALMKHYSNHLEKYEKSDISLAEKQFHHLRLLSLREWIHTKGFAALVQAINTFQKQVEENKIECTLIPESHGDSEEEKKLKKNQHHLLSWIEVLSDTHSHTAESPAAMRFIIQFLAETEQPLEKNRSGYVKNLEYFESFFLGSQFADINIANHSFKTNFETLKQHQADATWDQYKLSLETIRQNLIKFFNDIESLWTLNARSNYLHQFDLIHYTPSDIEEKDYQESLQKAFTFSLNSSSRRSTGQSDEPLRATSSTQSFQGFTPHDWEIFNNTNSKSGKTSSSRSERSSSKSPSLSHAHVTFSGSSLELVTLDGGSGSSSSKKMEIHSNK
jgi:hypothetical protein